MKFPLSLRGIVIVNDKLGVSPVHGWWFLIEITGTPEVYLYSPSSTPSSLTGDYVLIHFHFNVANSGVAKKALYTRTQRALWLYPQEFSLRLGPFWGSRDRDEASPWNNIMISAAAFVAF